MPTSLTKIIPKKSRTSGIPKRWKCIITRPTLKQVRYRNECPEEKRTDEDNSPKKEVAPTKPDDISIWAWKLKQQQYGHPPDATQYRFMKFRWEEKQAGKIAQTCEDQRFYELECVEPEHKRKIVKKYINPFSTRKKKQGLSGAQKRKIVERWGKMWDSAFSDAQFDRTVFEHNPDAEQTYKTDNERINDGCQKLCAIAKMNQNIITMMMKKFVSGPPSKLYTLNRIEAAQCWSRIINDHGLVNDYCCVDLPLRPTRGKFDIPSLKTPLALKKNPNFLKKMSVYRFPTSAKLAAVKCAGQDASQSESKSGFKKNPEYWLDPKLVPPVPPGFREDEFHIEPKSDPTGEIRRDLAKAKETAKRYTRFAHVIERAKYVVPNMERVNKTMDEHFVAQDSHIRKQTLLHNFFSSPKMDTSPDFRKDALYATILSRNDNPKGAVAKKPYPYSLAEMSKSKSRRM